MTRLIDPNAPRQTYTGVLSAFGTSPNGQRVTALKMVENHSGQTVADHVWIQKGLVNFSKHNTDALGTIISFIADPAEYYHYSEGAISYSLNPSGLIFEAHNVPKDLTTKFRHRIFKHKDQYFAGIIEDHKLRFIGQGSDGALRLTLRNVYFVESISKLLPIVKPYAHGQGIIVFKAIVYKGTPFFGMIPK